MTYARLLGADPARWRATAAAWRALAQRTGRRAHEVGPAVARLQAAWLGAASSAATTRLSGLHQSVQVARLDCWQTDQAISEFAAGLGRAKALLDEATAQADRRGLTIDPDGGVHARTATASRPTPIARPTEPAPTAQSGAAATHGAPGGDDVRFVATAIAAALAVAARADALAAGRLADIAAATDTPAGSPTGGMVLPSCGANPASVRRWWDDLTPTERRRLVTTEPAAIGALDGVPAAYRDLANRLRLDEQRAALDRAIATADDGRRCQLRELRTGLDFLADRLADDDGPRGYLLRLELTGEGRAVVALGDPDQADNVLTQVPGMTAGLASLHTELGRAERVAVRAEQLAPQESTSAVLWLDYDAPDFVSEAMSSGQAAAGAQGLHRFQDGLRATHGGPTAHQTVLGHSYGSLVVGMAATQPGLAADSVVFVGSPGVGVDAAAQLRTPAGQVWSTTSRSDVIQYAAVSPAGVVADVVRAAVLPIVGPMLAFGRPEDDLYFGHNPSDAGFGARVFGTQHDAGHLGYWDPGRPALDNLARITLGGPYQSQVTRP